MSGHKHKEVHDDDATKHADHVDITSMRDSAREILQEALGKSKASADIASTIVSELFHAQDSPNRGLSQHVRSLAFNLGNNSDLRKHVLAKQLSVKNLCSLTVQELAKPGVQAYRHHLEEEAMKHVTIVEKKGDHVTLCKSTRGEIEEVLVIPSADFGKALQVDEPLVREASGEDEKKMLEENFDNSDEASPTAKEPEKPAPEVSRAAKRAKLLERQVPPSTPTADSLAAKVKKNDKLDAGDEARVEAEIAEDNEEHEDDRERLVWSGTLVCAGGSEVVAKASRISGPRFPSVLPPVAHMLGRIPLVVVANYVEKMGELDRKYTLLAFEPIGSTENMDTFVEGLQTNGRAAVFVDSPEYVLYLLPGGDEADDLLQGRSPCSLLGVGLVHEHPEHHRQHAKYAVHE